jgi:endonuclease/exonuclease/phosphatase family metal-dependent hydrolase
MVELWFNERRLIVANVHLATSMDRVKARRMQMEALVETVGPCPLIVAGDTNMRVGDDDFGEKKLGLVDVWKSCGSDIRTKWT